MNIAGRLLIQSFAFAFLLYSAPPVWAATITWNNSAGGNWNVAGNWSPNQVPGAGDTATITAAGTYIVNISDTESAASLTVGGATGVQTLQVNSGGVLNESGGTLSITGSLKVQSGGLLNMTSQFSVEGPLTNAGTINLTNAALALYNNNGASYNGGINNQGQINFCGASGDQVASYIGDEYFINQGTVNQEAGTGISTINVFAGGLQGTYNAALGTILEFLGGNTAGAPLTVGAPPVLNGPGQYRFTSGYLLLTEVAITNLSLTGGVLELGSAFQGGAITNLTLEGIALAEGTNQVKGTLIVTNNSTINAVLTVDNGAVLDAYGGALAVTGSLTVKGGGVLNVASQFSVEGPLTNSGTINLTNAALALYNNNGASYNGGINNQGQINFYGSSGDQIASYIGDEYIINPGTISQRPGTGNSSISAAVFTDPGTLDSQEGTLTVSAISLQSSSVLNFGFNSPTAYGNIAFQASAVLSGTVSANLNNGFVPATGDTFKVLSYPSFSGTFARTNFPAGYVGQGIYGSTFFSLEITGTGTTPTNQPVLTIERVNASTVAVSWPTAAGNFNLQTSTKLPAETWDNVTSGITTVGANYVLTSAVGGENTFFRLQSQ
ncbi:MAG TPA: hypothetical protein VMR33_09785 [Candidatus Baltobacteraceae bacterium]|jgi:hypothetical protein|nr:hypothetical protein [Candidatus Baltobacteraceae bacterium]